MNRCELANRYYESGCNCSQSILAAFSDLIGMDEAACLRLGAGFGHGAGTGELCGAISGGIMVLDLTTTTDPADPAFRKQTMSASKTLQKQFLEKFQYLRCHDLLEHPASPGETTPAAQAMGLTRHCAIMIVTAVELVEALLKEAGIED